MLEGIPYHTLHFPTTLRTIYMCVCSPTTLHSTRLLSCGRSHPSLLPYQPVLPHKPPSISTLTDNQWNDTTLTIHFLILDVSIMRGRGEEISGKWGILLKQERETVLLWTGHELKVTGYLLWPNIFFTQKIIFCENYGMLNHGHMQNYTHYNFVTI